MKISIWTGAAYEPWGDDSVDAGGIGGSETAAIHMARELALKGCKVVLFGEHQGKEGKFNVPADLVQFYPGGTVEYVDYRKALEDPKLLTCDVFVSSRDKTVLRLKPDTKIKVLWVHDIHVGDDWHNEVPLFDRVYCLTNWHKHFFLDHYPNVDPEVVSVTRNGIDPQRFSPRMPWEELRAKKKPNFVWSSSLDRGLDVMLDVWPQVKSSCPEARLDIYYGIENWKKINAANPTGMAIIDYYMNRISAAAGDGVTYHGRVGQKVLAEAHMGALCWAYPTAWIETSCITALEAQAAGAFPVTSALAALNETVHSGFLVPGRNKSKAYKEMFVGYVKEVLGGAVDLSRCGISPGSQAALAEATGGFRTAADVDLIRRGNREWALSRTWSGVAGEWLADFAALAERKRA